MKKHARRLKLTHQTIADLQIAPSRIDATNSSECRGCSCEQHCEQVR